MTPSFSDRTWGERFKAMGDEAEQVFERVYKKNFVRYGFNRPPLQVWKLPLRIRYQPDYLTSDGLVECQGFGAKQTMALKVEKYNALQFWHQLFPVELFVYDSTHDHWAFVGLRRVDEWINSGRVVLRHFPEGKAYFEIPAGLIFDA